MGIKTIKQLGKALNAIHEKRVSAERDLPAVRKMAEERLEEFLAQLSPEALADLHLFAPGYVIKVEWDGKVPLFEFMKELREAGLVELDSYRHHYYARITYAGLDLTYIMAKRGLWPELLRR